MPRLISRLAALVLIVQLAAVTALSADTYRVVRNVRLLVSPGVAQKIKTLHPPDRVTATGGRNGDYIRVEDEEGDAGWVYAPYLAEDQAPAEPATPTPSVPSQPTPVQPEGVATSVSPSWEKPAPQNGDFHLNGKICGPVGNPGDTETNRRKNRTDIPATYHAVTFAALDQLPFPDAPTTRLSWTSSQLAQISPYEGVAVTVIGYLAKIRPQTGNSEACNCGWSGADETDWHMALVGKPGDPESVGMVVETTPRIRINHPMWTTTNLAPWTGTTEPIRVSGWVLMDPVHKAHLNHYRNTLWEVHPITKIEVMKGGSWVDLDNLGAGPS